MRARPHMTQGELVGKRGLEKETFPYGLPILLLLEGACGGLNRSRDPPTSDADKLSQPSSSNRTITCPIWGAPFRGPRIPAAPIPEEFRFARAVLSVCRRGSTPQRRSPRSQSADRRHWLLFVCARSGGRSQSPGASTTKARAETRKRLTMRSCNGWGEEMGTGSIGTEDSLTSPSSSPRTVFRDKYTVASCAIKWMLKTPSVSHSVYRRKMLEENAFGAEQDPKPPSGDLNGGRIISQSPQQVVFAGGVRSRFGCFTERQWGRISVIEASCPRLVQG